MNSPSPLVPQGAIPPRTMSRSARVLVVGFTVVAVHVVGLGLFLLQGCKKDVSTAGGAGDTNAPSTAALSFPTIDTNVYYTNAASLPAPATGTGMVTAATAMPGTTSAVATNFGIMPTAPTPGAGADSAFPSLPGDSTGTAAAAPEKEYKIAKGDTLSAIALRNGISISAIQQVNPGLDPRRLKIGQMVKIPPPKPSTTAAASTGASVGGAAGGGTYKVKSGDTLTRIASRHGVTVNELRAANNLRTTRLLAGQTLQIPQPAPRATAGRDAGQPQ